MAIRCIALDLDRTALNNQGKLSEANRLAIERAIDQGIHVVVASGRALKSLPSDILEIRGIQYAITSNGAAVYELHTGNCLREYKLTPESVRKVLELTEGSKAAYEAFISGQAYGQKEYVENPTAFGATPAAVPYIQSTRIPVPHFTDFLREHCHELDSLDVIVSSEEMKQKLWMTFQQEIKDIYITSSVRQLLELSYKDCGKHSGAGFILDYLGFTAEELAAFGDGDNDVDLLKFAGTGFAMENGSDLCKASADRIAPSNQEDGVAWGIEQILSENHGMQR